MGKTMQIAVVGLGYVGLSNAILLAQHHTVTAVDIDRERVASVNRRESPIIDDRITEFLRDKPLSLQATSDLNAACENAELVIIATPTNYDPHTNSFDTSSVQDVIRQVLDINPVATLVIKSTIPVGFVDQQREAHATNRIIFSPEFLREGRALHDNLYPSRIIVGDTTERARQFARLMAEGAAKSDIPELFTEPAEARPSSCLPTPIWPCGLPSLTNSTATRSHAA